MNTIFLTQNDAENRQMLMGMGRIYSQVKFVNHLNFLLSVILPVLAAIALPFARTAYPDLGDQLTIYMGCYGIAILVFTLMTGGLVARMKKKAAMLQEMYDCDVLRIKWNELKCGKMLTREDVYRCSAFYRKRSPAAFKDWYLNSHYDAPDNVLALLCHGKNLGWEVSQRLIMNRVYFGVLIFAFAVLITLGLYMKAGLSDFLYYIVFMLPFFRHGLMLFNENRKSLDRMTRIRDFVEKEVQGIKIGGQINDANLSHNLRAIQDELYTHRASSHPVPDLLHKIMRIKNEEVYDDYFASNLRVMIST